MCYKKFKGKLNMLINQQTVKITEMDELHSYIGSKKTIVGCGLQLIETENATLILLLGQEGQKRGKDCGKKYNR